MHPTVQELALPATLVTIGDGAFNGCVNWLPLEP